MVHIFTGIVHKKKSTIYLEANCTIYIHTFILWVLILDLLNSAPYKTPPEVQKIDGIDPWLCSCSPGKWGSLEQWDRWFGRVPYLSMWATKKGPCLFRVYRGLSYLVMWGLWWNGSPPFGLPTACFTLLKKKTLWCHWRQQTYQACQSKIEQQIQKKKVWLGSMDESHEVSKELFVPSKMVNLKCMA